MVRPFALIAAALLLTGCVGAFGEPKDPRASCQSRCERDLDICTDSRSQGGFGNVGGRNTAACRDFHGDCLDRCGG